MDKNNKNKVNRERELSKDRYLEKPKEDKIDIKDLIKILKDIEEKKASEDIVKEDRIENIPTRRFLEEPKTEEITEIIPRARDNVEGIITSTDIDREDRENRGNYQASNYGINFGNYTALGGPQINESIAVRKFIELGIVDRNNPLHVQRLNIEKGMGEAHPGFTGEQLIIYTNNILSSLNKKEEFTYMRKLT